MTVDGFTTGLEKPDPMVIAAGPRATAPSHAIGHTIRGILIVAIVFGHDRLLFETIPFYFAAFYFWHVQGFFFLAYGRQQTMAAVSILDRLVRYLVPFLWIVGALSVLRLAIGPLNSGTVATAMAAIVIGTAPLVDSATGLALFWFLPTLAGFTMAMILLARLAKRGPGAAVLGTAIPLAGFAASITVPERILQFLPLGVGLVGYLITLAILHRGCLNMLDRSGNRPVKIVLWVVVLLVLCGEAIAISRGNVVNISVFAFSQPKLIWLALLNGAATIAAGVVVFRLAPFLIWSRSLQFLGARSLDIFLVHQFFLYPMTLLIHAKLRNPPLFVTVLTGIGAALVALLLASLASRALDRFPVIRAMVFPKDLAALRMFWKLSSKRKSHSPIAVGTINGSSK